MRERRFPDGRRSDRAQCMTARTEPALSGTVPFLHSQPRVWIFDMDDTLLASSAGILDEVHVLMNDFLIRRMGFSREKANFLREYYWRTYGSTFIGLWRCHGVDPRVFLPAVHDFDYAPYLTGLKSMRAVLSKFPGRRVLMTNGPRNYADAILPAIGLKGFFDLEVTSSDMRLFGDWRPKPSVAMMKALAARLGVKSRDAVLVDDSLLNLRAAKLAGMRTVWCIGMRRRHAGLRMPWNAPMAHPAIDLVVCNVEELLRRIGRI